MKENIYNITTMSPLFSSPPSDKAKPLPVLKRYYILDTKAGHSFKQFAQLAARYFDVQIHTEFAATTS